MTTICYEEQAHRLRIAGDCRTSDFRDVHEALAPWMRLAVGHLIVDLTAVTAIDAAIAEEIVRAAYRSRGRDGTVVFIRKHGTAVDAALVAAERAMRAGELGPAHCPDPATKMQNGCPTGSART